MRILGLGLLVCRAAASGGPSAPNAGEYVIRSWGLDDGLPQSSVLGIVQTRDQFLWLATYGGLTRFDGAAFTTYDPGLTPGLSSSRILAVTEARDGVLWAATQETGLVEHRGGKFKTHGAGSGLPGNRFNGTRADSRGSVWSITNRELVERRDGKFTEIPLPAGAYEPLALAEAKDGGVWLGTNSAIVRAGADRSARIRFDGIGPVTAIHEDRAGTLWAGCAGGLWRYGRGEPGERPTSTPVRGEIRAILEDSRGALWAGGTEGLWRLEQGEWRRFGREDGLSEDSIRAILEDGEGNLWVGTNARGLNRMTRRRVGVIAAQSGLPTTNTVPVMESRSGDIWIGLTCGGAVRYRGGEYRLLGEKDGLPNACVWSLGETRDGAIWIGTRGGLARFDGGPPRVYTVNNSGLSDNWVTAILEDRAGNLWIATGAGLSRFSGGKFAVLRRDSGLVSDDVRFLHEDRDGGLWIGTTGGMSHYKDGAFRNFTTANGLPHAFVRAIHPGDDGAVWIGTYGGGLARMKGGQFTYFNVRNGLPENVVSRILDDGEGSLWLSGNRGIHRARLDDLNRFADSGAPYPVFTYGVTDGMSSRECNGGATPAGWRTRDGTLLFPTQQGVAVLDARRSGMNKHPPVVMIDSVMLNRARVETAGGVRVPPGSGAIEVNYLGLSYTAPEKVRFRYRMKGHEEAWTEAGTRRTAYYTQLPAGSYSFEVLAANSDGVWSPAPASLGVFVAPFFWMTAWFRVSVAVTAAGALVSIYRRRVNGLKRKQELQLAFSHRLIESQENERKRIAGELHDSLSQTLAIIKNRAHLGLAAGGSEAAAEQLDEIADASSHALEEVRRIAYDLRPVHLDRLGLTESIQAMVRRVSAPGDFQLEARLANIDGFLAPEEEINLFRIVQESVNNILKHSGATRASVAVERGPDEIKVRIQDNGRGFDERQPRGFGLTGIQERARILGGSVTIEPAPGKGAAIELTIRRPAREHGHRD